MSDRHAACLFLALANTALCAQTASPADPLLSLSPQAAYDQALLPVAIVHRSVSNWSPSEAASLAVAIQEAQGFCQARPAAQLTGPTTNADLLGLARLCALGQQWPAVLDSSNRLLAALPIPASPSPNTPPDSSGTVSPRAQALAFKIEAALNLKDPATALAAANTLLDTEPYTALAQQTTDGLLSYLQLIQTSDALNLAGKRLDRILPLLRSAVAPTPAASAAGLLSAHELYAAALAVPTLLQLGNNIGAAAGSLVTIEEALPANLPPDETILIALARRRYALLDSVLPPIPASASLLAPNATPNFNRHFGAATVLFVFPDWCAQCVRTGATQFLPFLTRHTADDVHLDGLLAQQNPPPLAAPGSSIPAHRLRSAPPPSAGANPPTATDLLRGTPTLVVPSTLPLTAFAATDFPLLIVADHDGRIRFAQVAPEDAFVPGSLVDQLVARVIELWPPSAAAAATHP